MQRPIKDLPNFKVGPILKTKAPCSSIELLVFLIVPLYSSQYLYAAPINPAPCPLYSS